MRCKDIERMILDSTERDLSPEERQTLEKHIQGCASCAGFRDDLGRLRLSLSERVGPCLPLDLDEETLRRCREEIRTHNRPSKERVSVSTGGVPKLIWAALAALIVLTVLFLVPLGQEIRAGQAISPLSAFVLVLIFQNVVMGILAPVLLQRR